MILGLILRTLAAIGLCSGGNAESRGGCRNLGKDFQSMTVLTCTHLKSQLPMFHEKIIHLVNIDSVESILPAFAVPHVFGIRISNTKSLSLDPLARIFESVQVIELENIDSLDLGDNTFENLPDLKILRIKKSSLPRGYTESFYRHNSIVELSLNNRCHNICCIETQIIDIGYVYFTELPDFHRLPSLQSIKVSGNFTTVPETLISRMNMPQSLLKVIIEFPTLGYVPEELFKVAYCRELIIYSMSFDCSCSQDWLKVIAKFVLLPGWSEKVRGFLSSNIQPQISNNLSIYIGGYCDRARKPNRTVQQRVPFLKSSICCHLGYYDCPVDSRCIQKGSDSSCVCNKGFSRDSYGICTK